MCINRLHTFSCGHTTPHRVSRCRRRFQTPPVLNANGHQKRRPQPLCKGTPDITITFEGDCYKCQERLQQEEEEAQMARAHALRLARKEPVFEFVCSEVEHDNGPSFANAGFKDVIGTGDMRSLAMMSAALDAELSDIEASHTPRTSTPSLTLQVPTPVRHHSQRSPARLSIPRSASSTHRLMSPMSPIKSPSGRTRRPALLTVPKSLIHQEASPTSPVMRFDWAMPSISHVCAGA